MHQQQVLQPNHAVVINIRKAILSGNALAKKEDDFAIESTGWAVQEADEKPSEIATGAPM